MDIRTVSKRAGVSIATVSRVLNGRSNVSDELRSRVIASVRELGYSPDGIARSLRLRKSMTVGAMLSDLGNPVVSMMFKAATEVLGQAGYLTLVAQSPFNVEKELEVFHSLMERRVDGLLWSVSDEESPEVRHVVTNARTPMVLIERRIEGVGVDSVVADHYSAMVEALRDLIDAGHRCIGIIPGAKREWPRRERLRAFNDVIGGHGTDVVGLVGEFDGVSSPENGEMAALQLLGSVPRPTAMVAGGNRVMIGAWRSARKLGLRIPEDIEFVASTLADPDLEDVAGLRFAGVEVPATSIGRAAGELLAKRLSGAEAGDAKSIVVPAVYRGLRTSRRGAEGV